MVSHSRRTVLLGVVLAIATPLWAAGPIKVPLVTTAIPADTTYVPPSNALGGAFPGQFVLRDEKPTTTFTLGGIEYTVQTETPPKAPDNQKLGTIVEVESKLLLKNTAQSFTFGSDASAKPMELTLDKGRKYLLSGEGYSFSLYIDPKVKKCVTTQGMLRPAGVQTGKIGSSPQSTIAIFDANMDGFYTSDKDGIVIGKPIEFVDSYKTAKKLYLVQPLSKYISTPGGIFEIQNLAKDGSELTVLPYAGATANLEVIAPPKYCGQIIMTSSDANLNVTLNGKAGESVKIIPGAYTMLAARLYTPSQDKSRPQGQWMYVSGNEMPALQVKAGAKQTLTLSGPKVLEFQAAMVKGKVNINPETLRTKGQAGETYLPAYDRTKPPEVTLNVDGKSTSLGKMEFG
ncbi:MAG: hypothetical protein FWD61_07505 [Phycisphaerales bacterium]|nr:hypothetical protein [Phycisphaerales bacterium]